MQMLHIDGLLCRSYVNNIGLASFLFGLGMQFGVHFLSGYLFNKTAYIVNSLVGILLLTLGAVLMEASPFMKKNAGDDEDDWFPAKRDDLTKEHSLFIFCRADFDEGYFNGEDELEARVDKTQDQLEKLDAKFDVIQKMIEEKLKPNNS